MNTERANDNINLNRPINPYLCMELSLLAWNLYGLSEEFIRPTDRIKYRQAFADLNVLIQREIENDKLNKLRRLK